MRDRVICLDAGSLIWNTQIAGESLVRDEWAHAVSVVKINNDPALRRSEIDLRSMIPQFSFSAGSPDPQEESRADQGHSKSLLKSRLRMEHPKSIVKPIRDISVIKFSVRNRDLGGTIADAQETVRRKKSDSWLCSASRFKQGFSLLPILINFGRKGSSLDLSPDSGTVVNPFDLEQGAIRPSPEKVKFLTALFDEILGDAGNLSKLERVLLETEMGICDGTICASAV